MKQEPTTTRVRTIRGKGHSDSAPELEALRQEVQRLARRVHHLEQLAKRWRPTEMQPTRSPAMSLFTLLGRPTSQ